MKEIPLDPTMAHNNTINDEVLSVLALATSNQTTNLSLPHEPGHNQARISQIPLRKEMLGE